MNQYTNGYVGNRVLKLNVGFLLSAGPGHLHETTFDVPRIRVAEDLDLNYIRGPLRLSRTKEGILVQGKLTAGVDEECLRCLDPIDRAFVIELEELYAYPAEATLEFSIGEDAILDLAPLLRAEVLIKDAHGALCRPDCQGLCPDCGVNLNHGECICDNVEVDPRLAALKQLLNR